MNSTEVSTLDSVTSPAPAPATKSGQKTVTKRVSKESLLIQLWSFRLAAYYLGIFPTASRNPVPGVLRKSPRWRGTVRLDRRILAENQLEGIALLVEAPPPPGECTEYEKTLHYSQHLQGKITTLEKKIGASPWRSLLKPHLTKNFEAINTMLCLDDTELRCLAFVVLMGSHSQMTFACSVLDTDLSDHQAHEAIAAAIGADSRTVQRTLGSEGRLANCQLLRTDHREQPLRGKFDWVSRNFAAELLNPDFNPMRALRDRITVAAPRKLTWEDYQHLAEARDITFKYVQRALDEQKQGVNILLHSPPGCGKSELVRILADKLDCMLYEVSTQDEDGDPIEGSKRLQALRVAQGFCVQQRCLIVFDEVEDVLPAPHPVFGAALRPPVRKGWINRMLETNPCVTFWLTNAPEALDRAFIRRFDLVWEVKGPPPAQREAHLRALPISLPEGSVKKLAACDQLSYAVISRAASVVEAIKDSIGVQGAPHMLETIVSQNLLAQRLPELKPVSVPHDIYDPTLINCPLNLVELVEGIRRAGSGRLCLYGPPGTGKSAYGQWLSQQVGRPAQLKRASDLLSPYVGQAEKNIAAAFRSARDAGAVLIVDEVDSFLQDRRQAHRSWEVSLVNEFLTQMEAFEGVFVATTNLLEKTDSAAWRRFDLTAQFDFLRAEQALRLLDRHLQSSALPPANAAAAARLGLLPTLAPGDFAAVARQARFRPLKSAEEWISALEAAGQAKNGVTRQIIGFSSHVPQQILAS